MPLPHHPHAVRPNLPNARHCENGMHTKLRRLGLHHGPPEHLRSHTDTSTPWHMAICEVSCVFRSHCPQQEVGMGGTTHHEEEPCRLWVAHPRDPKEKGCLCSRPFFARNSWTQAGRPMGTPKTFSPCSLKGNSISPLHTTTSSFTSLGASVNSSVAIWHTLLLGSKLVSCRSAFGCERVPASLAPQYQTLPQTLFDAHTAKMSSKKAINLSPTLSRACAASNETCCPRSKQKVALLPLLPLWVCAG